MDSLLRLSVDQYHAMIRAGIFKDGDPIELLEGWLVRKMTKYPRHSGVTRRTRHALERITPLGWFVDTQEPVTTSESEPEPDVSVVRGRLSEYDHRHPNPTDTALLVEVADSSLDRDRGIKKRIYARARVPVYWIVNLVDNQVEVYTNPSGPTENPDYASRQDFKPGEELDVVIDGQIVGKLAVSDLFP
jgi:Uma2 family endonuclease